MKVWITKHALTRGIRQETADICSHTDGKMIRVKRTGCYEFYHTPEWHVDQQKAIKHAETMRQRKINGLKKQIDKFESLRF